VFIAQMVYIEKLMKKISN